VNWGKGIRSFFNALFRGDLDFRVRLFNVLAMAGALVSLAVAALGPFTGAAPMNSLTCLFSFFLAVVFLYYSNRTGRYRIFYIITIVIVFVLLFPVMFFTAGGYHSGMPVFFVFAVVFTVFMLDGKAAFLMAALELLVYTGLCLYAFGRPESVHFFETEGKLLADVIIAIVTVSLTLGITMFLHFRIYNEQRRQLEKAREEAVRLSEIKSTFLANMSHEIRTPINVILGMNEMVLRESALLPKGAEEIAGYGLSIETAGKTLLELINNILDISKIESGKTEVLNEGYRTVDLARELALAGSEGAGKRGLRFILEADANMPRGLYGDFIHLKQIGLNFLSNAAKYTEQGSITLRISGTRQGKAGRDGTGDSPAPKFLLRIAVEDTGIGIKEADRGTLFDAFTRVDLPAHRHIEGTGLGLAIAKELADLMGGQITVESEWGRGSVFVFEVPQVIQDDEPLGRDSASAGRAPGETFFTAKGGRVLAVDDSRENLLVLSSLLRRTRLTVDTVSSGSECLEALKQKDYHLIFMDYMMSGLDGIETFRRIREENKNFAVPVIVLSADARREMEERFLAEGFSACLTKPVMWRELESCLRQWLPAELIVRETPGEVLEEPPDSPEFREGLARDLAAWGVVLEEGLRYLAPGTGLSQYKRLAEFFTEDYEAARREALVVVDQKNWKDLSFSVHSLKSKARAIGAADLYDTAARLEKYCMAGDGTYIERALPLLLLEWERAYRGLEQFIARMNEVSAPVEAEPRRAGSFGGSSGAYMSGARASGADRETLLRCIRDNRFNEAEEVLTRLLPAADDAEKRKLMAVREKIRALDFEGAERLLENEE
jgi:signal transduction histidine kinase/HPt (histidine-containing phosphotransfer) domain-containing protein